MPLLQCVKLHKTYAGRVVVDDMSFHIERGEIVGLLGRNGAGKTTSFRMTIGMIDADPANSGGAGDGRVYFDGRDITTLPMYKRARLGMGYLSQEPSIFQRLTCEQNLLAILETTGTPHGQRKKKAAELLERFGLKHKARHLARTCSGGERRKLEIARALVTNPKLILLDEPFSGVDPIAVEDLQNEIRHLAHDHGPGREGIAFLITDHNVRETLGICDRAYIMSDGAVLAKGSPEDVLANKQVREVYLGKEFRM